MPEASTAEEELRLLEDSLRRLKVEYDIFFGGGSKRPPNDTEWRVQALLKKYGDTQNLSPSQRFRYNAVAQRYAIFSDLWRQKTKIKEEGYRRPQDALLSIQGLRTEDEHAAADALKHPPVVTAANQSGQPSAAPSTQLSQPASTPTSIAKAPILPGRSQVSDVSIATADPARESDKVRQLFDALLEARRRTGEGAAGNFESFLTFVSQKTAQIRRDSACEAVEFRVELQDHKVRLKARPRK